VIGVIALAAILATWPFEGQAQPTQTAQSLHFNIEPRHVEIWSDGTRLSGDLFFPKDLKAGDRLPTVHLKADNDNAESSTHDPDRSTRTESLFEMMVNLRPDGWETLDEVKQFMPENLYELIDGRAELYLAYDMVKMTFTSFVNGADAEKFIELSIYDMGTPTNAFGVFSVERSKEVTSLALGRASYRMDAHYFIWKGPYYIRIITSDASEEFETIGRDLAVKVTNFLPDAGESVWGLSALSQLDLEPDSVKYFKVDAMGLDFMRNTYTAQYRKDESLITVFLSQEESAESAETTVGRYTGYAKRYGDTVERLTFENIKLTACDMKGSYDVVFSKGRLVAGVYSAEDKILAVRTAAELWRKLSDE
jgi:hypothetical protein